PAEPPGRPPPWSRLSALPRPTTAAGHVREPTAGRARGATTLPVERERPAAESGRLVSFPLRGRNTSKCAWASFNSAVPKHQAAEAPPGGQREGQAPARPSRRVA